MVTVDYANSDLKLRKPLIVAEGFDPGHILKPENRFGLSNIEQFITDATDDGSALTNLLSGSLQEYDIVYVDWTDGTDFLQRNALTLEEVIRWVNDKKAADAVSNEPNVVWGQSMGGVIARWALKDMEDNSELHNVRLFISHDAPQQGANVPQGYQHAARQAKDIYLRLGITDLIEIIQPLGISPLRALNLAEEPAARQMLINYVDNNNTIDNSEHDSWQTELENLGYPNGDGVTSFRKVAVSNGSECGATQSFGAGDALLSFQGHANTRFLGDLLSSLFLPTGGSTPLTFLGSFNGRNDFKADVYVASQADGSSNLVYKGKLEFKKTILWIIGVNTTISDRTYYSSSANLPYDYFPGGLEPVGNFSGASFENAVIKFNAFGFMQPTFGFIPIVSSLDIGSGSASLTETDYLTSYVGSNPPSSPKNTPFDNFITAFNNGSNNEQHISIERRNGDWIADELNGNVPGADCTAFCGAIINGSSSVCNSDENYSLNITLPIGASVFWSANPFGIVSISTSNNSATLSQTGYGSVTLTATIISGSSCGDITLTKTITVGGPQVTFSLQGNTFNQQFCTNAFGNFVEASPDDLSNVTGLSWGYSSAENSISPTVINSSGNYSQDFMFSVGGNYQIFANALNSCGSGSIATLNIFVNDNCNGQKVKGLIKENNSLAIYPNPAKDILYITLPDSIDLRKTIITITDLYGRAVKKIEKLSYYNTISISTLASGIYLIEISEDKKSIKREKIFKN